VKFYFSESKNHKQQYIDESVIKNLPYYLILFILNKGKFLF